MYRFDVGFMQTKLSHENLRTLLAAALYCQLPQELDAYKRAVRAKVNKRRQWRDEGVTVLLPQLRERVRALEVVLGMVHLPRAVSDEDGDVSVLISSP